MSPIDGVRSARDDNKLTVFNQLRESCCGGLKRQNPIAISMNDQGWYINAGQIIAEIGEPRWNTVQSPFSRSPCCHIPTCLNCFIANPLTQQYIHIEEFFEKCRKVSWTIFNDRFHNAIENALIDTFRIVIGLQ